MRFTPPKIQYRQVVSQGPLLDVSKELLHQGDWYQLAHLDGRHRFKRALEMALPAPETLERERMKKFVFSRPFVTQPGVGLRTMQRECVYTFPL